jgi:hypothetical protein
VTEGALSAMLYMEDISMPWPILSPGCGTMLSLYAAGCTLKRSDLEHVVRQAEAKICCWPWSFSPRSLLSRSACYLCHCCLGQLITTLTHCVGPSSFSKIAPGSHCRRYPCQQDCVLQGGGPPLWLVRPPQLHIPARRLPLRCYSHG